MSAKQAIEPDWETAQVLRAIAELPPDHRLMAAMIHAAIKGGMPCASMLSAVRSMEEFTHQQAYTRIVAAVHALADAMTIEAGDAG